MEYNANTRVYMDVNSDYLEIKIFRKQRRKERIHIIKRADHLKSVCHISINDFRYLTCLKTASPSNNYIKRKAISGQTILQITEKQTS